MAEEEQQDKSGAGQDWGRLARLNASKNKKNKKGEGSKVQMAKETTKGAVKGAAKGVSGAVPTAGLSVLGWGALGAARGLMKAPGSLEAKASFMMLIMLGLSLVVIVTIVVLIMIILGPLLGIILWWYS
jgi:hypothetical protein